MIAIPSKLESYYAGKTVLVTGGLGFIGSNAALTLQRLGAHVRVLDSFVAGCGANYHNLAAAGSSIDLIEADLGDPLHASRALRGVDCILNLAGEISHAGSMTNPLRDLELNVVSQLRFLQLCTSICPGVRVVYTCTRQVYGSPLALPVGEAHPIQPADFNGVHKHAAAEYHHLLTRHGRLDAVILRLTNIYGPRMALHLSGQGFFAEFLRSSLRGQRLKVFGDGAQLRDPVYVGDAVTALLRAGAVRNPRHRTINIGHPDPVSVLRIAQTLSRLAHLPEPLVVPFPADRKAIDIGSYATSTSRARRILGWSARTPLAEGLSATLDFFHAALAHYVPPHLHRAASL